MFSTIGYYICIPFAALLRFFYNLTGSYGVAILLFTLVIKLILLPFQLKSKKSMMRMTRLSGKMQEIQKKYANNQIKANEEIQKLYAEEGVNPMGGCLWSMLPLPILLALYSIIRQPITHFMMLSSEALQKLVDGVTAAGVDMSGIVMMKDGAAVVKDGFTQLSAYGQINLVKAITSQAPEVGNSVEGWIHMNYDFLGIDLTATPWSAVTGFVLTWACIGLILVPILSGLSQFLVAKVSMKAQPQTSANGSGKAMLYTMPLFSVYIAFIMPAALGLYWIAQSVFSIIQESVMNHFFLSRMEQEEAAAYEARQADRQRRMEEGRRQQEELRQQQAQKQTLREKQKAAQEAKALKAQKAATSTTEAGRVGDRPYARGRSYREDRYDDLEK